MFRHFYFSMNDASQYTVNSLRVPLKIFILLPVWLGQIQTTNVILCYFYLNNFFQSNQRIASFICLIYWIIWAMIFKAKTRISIIKKNILEMYTFLQTITKINSVYQWKIGRRYILELQPCTSVYQVNKLRTKCDTRNLSLLPFILERFVFTLQINTSRRQIIDSKLVMLKCLVVLTIYSIPFIVKSAIYFIFILIGMRFFVYIFNGNKVIKQSKNVKSFHFR